MVEGEKSLTPAGNVKAALLTTVASWVLEAWRDLPEEMVARSFKKCGISNSTDGTEDDMLWEEEEGSVRDEESVTVTEERTKKEPEKVRMNDFKTSFNYLSSPPKICLIYK